MPGRLVRHGVNGLVYAPGSEGGLESLLRLAARDPSLCARLGARAESDARAYRSDLVFRPVLAGLERIRSRKGTRSVSFRNDLAPER